MKKLVKYIIISLLFSFVGSGASLWANNIQIPTLPEVTPVGQDAIVSFDLQWDHSWRLAAFNNWDAAWVFMKFNKGNTTWEQVYFDASPAAHQITNNGGTAMTFKPGMSKIESLSGDERAVGMFIYRSAEGKGSVKLTGVKMKWLSNAQGITAEDITEKKVQVRVFAIEMVYIPEGAFFLGSGGGEARAFRQAYSNVPFQLVAEDELQLVNASTSYPSGSTTHLSVTNNWGNTGVLPAAFPKGYQAFYAMKYELSQEGYADFLNTLTTTQQQARANNRNPLSYIGYIWSSNATTMSYRNSIALVPLSDGANKEFRCNYVNEGMTEEYSNNQNDGQNIAMNYMKIEDYLAYLDWACLRPLTELEYEKMCRGPQTPVANAYAWGTVNMASCLNPNTNVSKPGLADETGMYGCCNGNDYPLRTGSFATDKSNRLESGAGYYGVMDLTGNVAECYVNIQFSPVYSYTGDHGDGTLAANGTASTTYMAWPTAITSYIWRGGFASTVSYMRTSDRFFAAQGIVVTAGRNPQVEADYYVAGCRGGRTE